MWKNFILSYKLFWLFECALCIFLNASLLIHSYTHPSLLPFAWLLMGSSFRARTWLILKLRAVQVSDRWLRTAKVILFWWRFYILFWNKLGTWQVFSSVYRLKMPKCCENCLVTENLRNHTPFISPLHWGSRMRTQKTDTFGPSWIRRLLWRFKFQKIRFLSCHCHPLTVS